MRQNKIWFILLAFVALTFTTTICYRQLTIESKKDNALKSLQKISAALEMKMTQDDYHHRIAREKSEFEEKLVELDEGKFKNEIKDALQAFIDAEQIWSSPTLVGFVIMDNEPAKSIFAKHDVPATNDLQKIYDEINRGVAPKSTGKTEALSLIWQKANLHIEKAKQTKSQESLIW